MRIGRGKKINVKRSAACDDSHNVLFGSTDINHMTPCGVEKQSPSVVAVYKRNRYITPYIPYPYLRCKARFFYTTARSVAETVYFCSVTIGYSRVKAAALLFYSRRRDQRFSACVGESKAAVGAHFKAGVFNGYHRFFTFFFT